MGGSARGDVQNWAQPNLSSKPTEQILPKASPISPTSHPATMVTSILIFKLILCCSAMQPLPKAVSFPWIPAPHSMREVPALTWRTCSTSATWGKNRIGVAQRLMFNSFHQLQSQGLCLDPPQHGAPRAVLWDLGFEVVQRHWEPQEREHSGCTKGTAAQNSLSVLGVHPTEPDGSQGVVSPEKHPGRGEGIVRKGKGLGEDTNLQIQALLCL